MRLKRADFSRFQKFEDPHHCPSIVAARMIVLVKLAGKPQAPSSPARLQLTRLYACETDSNPGLGTSGRR
jgi:hypothetical protein